MLSQHLARTNNQACLQLKGVSVFCDCGIQPDCSNEEQQHQQAQSKLGRCHPCMQQQQYSNLKLEIVQSSDNIPVNMAVGSSCVQWHTCGPDCMYCTCSTICMLAGEQTPAAGGKHSQRCVQRNSFACPACLHYLDVLTAQNCKLLVFMVLLLSQQQLQCTCMPLLHAWDCSQAGHQGGRQDRQERGSMQGSRNGRAFFSKR